MRRSHWRRVIALTLAVGLAAPALAQDAAERRGPAEQWTRCLNRDETLAPALVIESCTAVIDARAVPRTDLAHAYFLRATAHAAANQYQSAIPDYTEAHRLTPRDPYALTFRGVAFHHLGDYERALTDMDAAIRLDPDLSYARSARAALRATLGEHERALEDYDRAVRQGEMDADRTTRAYVLHNRGISHRTLGRHERAIADFTEALALDPQFVSAIANRGITRLIEGGDTLLAMNDFNDALRIRPRSALALYGRGIALVRLGQREAGQDEIARALEQDPNVSASYRALGVHEGAASLLESK